MCSAPSDDRGLRSKCSSLCDDLAVDSQKLVLDAAGFLLDLNAFLFQRIVGSLYSVNHFLQLLVLFELWYCKDRHQICLCQVQSSRILSQLGVDFEGLPQEAMI